MYPGACAHYSGGGKVEIFRRRLCSHLPLRPLPHPHPAQLLFDAHFCNYTTVAHTAVRAWLKHFAVQPFGSGCACPMGWLGLSSRTCNGRRSCGEYADRHDVQWRQHHGNRGVQLARWLLVAGGRWRVKTRTVREGPWNGEVPPHGCRGSTPPRQGRLGVTASSPFRDSCGGSRPPWP